MASYRTRRKSPRRYVRLVLEELEWRYVPSLLGVQLDLPLPAILSPVSLSVGTGTAPAPVSATTAPPATTSPGTTTTSPATETISVSITFTTTAPGSNPSSAPAAGSSAGVFQPSAPASSAGGTGASPVGFTSVFSEGIGQGSGGAFAAPSSAPAAFAPGLAIQAATASESTALEGSVNGFNFQLLGNLPTLLGTANGLQGTANASLSTASSAGTPLVIARPDLFTDRTTGATTALGLTQPAPGDREEPLPEQLLIPPDEDEFEPVPQNVEQTLPSDNVPARFLRMEPPQPDAVESQLFDAPPADQSEGAIFNEEDIGIPADEEQPEERSGMSAAVAIISFGTGAYWTIRDRRLRRVAADLPLSAVEM